MPAYLVVIRRINSRHVWVEANTPTSARSKAETLGAKLAYTTLEALHETEEYRIDHVSRTVMPAKEV